MNIDCEPGFARVPEDWRGRGDLLRRFAHRWHGVKLGESGRPCPRVDREESNLGHLLPLSFREWIRFSDDLLEETRFGILRDDYEVSRLRDFPAISLMIQGEADVT